MDQQSLRFTKSHEWASLTGDVCTVGITSFAAVQLQDITYIKLPAVGTRLKADASFGEIETVKAVSDLYAPVGGEVVAMNQGVADTPETLKANPFGAAWLVKIRVPAGTTLNHLMTLADYEKQIQAEQQ